MLLPARSVAVSHASAKAAAARSRGRHTGGKDARSGGMPIASQTRDAADAPHHTRGFMPLAKDKHADTGRMLLSIAAVVAVLHFAEDVLIPVAMAVLLTFLLAPLTERAERRGLPRAASVALATLLAFLLIGGLVWTVTHQFFGLVEELPAYRDNLVAKLRALPGTTANGLERGVETVKEITDELQKASPGVPESPEIAKVRVVPPPPSMTELVRSVFGPLVGPVSTAGIVVVFVIFMLLQREDLRDRLVRMLGAGEMHATVKALDDAAQRISRYLSMQTLINAIQGALVGLGLWLIGVPDALLWGTLTVVLRFIPYLGPVLAAAGPIAVSVAFFPGWTQPLLVLGWIVLLELLTNNILEPRLYGSSVGISSFALIVAAVFWSWLWGAAGLFLATPLTVCLAVMGKHIPPLGFLAVLLGDQPVLEPHERFYQRLLADDPDEAEDLLDEALAEATLLETADAMLLPALRLAEHDFERGAIELSRRNAIVDQVGELIDELPKAPEESEAAPADGQRRLAVLCLPAADRADEVAALILARVLTPLGIDAEVLPAATLKGEMLERVAQSPPDALCISAAPPAAVIHARYLCKKLRGVSRLPLIVGLWNAQGDIGRARDRLSASGADFVASRAAEVVDELNARLQGLRQVEPAAPAPPQRLVPI